MHSGFVADTLSSQVRGLPETKPVPKLFAKIWKFAIGEMTSPLVVGNMRSIREIGATESTLKSRRVDLPWQIVVIFATSVPRFGGFTPFSSFATYTRDAPVLVAR